MLSVTQISAFLPETAESSLAIASTEAVVIWLAKASLFSA
jgi:hypothetical protein